MNSHNRSGKGGSVVHWFSGSAAKQLSNGLYKQYIL